MKKTTYTIVKQLMIKNKIGNAWTLAGIAEPVVASTSKEKLKSILFDEVEKFTKEMMEEDKQLDDVIEYTYDYDYYDDGELRCSGVHTARLKWEFTITSCRTI